MQRHKYSRTDLFNHLLTSLCILLLPPNPSYHPKGKKMDSLEETRRTALVTIRNSLRSDFDEFFQQLHSLGQLAAEQDLRGHPELDFIASLQEKAEVRRVLPTALSAKCEVDQLLLQEDRCTSAFIFSRDKLIQKSVHG